MDDGLADLSDLLSLIRGRAHSSAASLSRSTNNRMPT
ncbi:MAG: hypothetical protein BWY06_02871 [Candidatus Latescibacteria bacterium ADurb.Bin168]|nr:MAG: hypothetical protein BWY06_02871 [Candidatus Latescibacteria bacterium ADurb.Bin168]